ncbi:MAG TPA: hypothetical protein VJ487_08280, partial [Alphaproteobacteria bacterium]|nr:hypothetical protein [Alphaproteobacteria bacterium]
MTYMISLNHGPSMKSIAVLHAYNIAANPRKPAQTLAFAPKTSRKFGLTTAGLSPACDPCFYSIGRIARLAARWRACRRPSGAWAAAGALTTD